MNKTVSITSLPSATGFGPSDSIVGINNGQASLFPYGLIGGATGATGSTGNTGPAGPTGTVTLPYNIYTALITQTTVSSTDGFPNGSYELIEGKSYIVNGLQSGDDFTNVGYIEDFTPFVATGSIPTSWSNGTDVIDYEASQPSVNILQDTITGINVYTGFIEIGGGKKSFSIIIEKPDSFPLNKILFTNVGSPTVPFIVNTSQLAISTEDVILGGTFPIEIRVYN